MLAAWLSGAVVVAALVILTDPASREAWAVFFGRRW